MRIVSRSTLLAFGNRYAGAKGGLAGWYDITKAAQWACMADVVRDFPTADPVGPKHVVFNICGNKYRLVCAVFFPAKTLWVKFVGTHARYDKINVREL